ncbi:MAG: hypothetical protein AABY62_03925 [Pseudomonadota bacterium]
MRDIKTQLRLPARWLKYGLRLFRRNPWLLLGLGTASAVLLGLLLLIPFLGGLLATAVAPVLLAGGYQALHDTARLSQPVSGEPIGTAMARAPRVFLSIFRNGQLTLALIMASIYALIVALLINILVRIIAGPAWANPLAALDILPLLGVLAGMLAGFALYSLLAMTLVFALPLAMFQDEPLVPAALRSFRRCLRYVVAILIMLALSLVPVYVNGIMGMASAVLGYLSAVLVGAVTLPLAVAAFYCGYQDLCPPAEEREAA